MEQYITSVRAYILHVSHFIKYRDCVYKPSFIYKYINIIYIFYIYIFISRNY